MPRHNQERSQFVSGASARDRERAEQVGRQARSSHWSRNDHRRGMDETEVLSVRNVEELQDFVGRY